MTIRERFYKWRINRYLKNSELSPRGIYLYQYLKDILAGDKVFIQHYEDYLERFQKQTGYSRENAISYLMKMFELVLDTMSRRKEAEN